MPSEKINEHDLGNDSIADMSNESIERLTRLLALPASCGVAEQSLEWLDDQREQLLSFPRDLLRPRTRSGGSPPPSSTST